MHTVKYLFVILINIEMAKAEYEWSQWTLCTLGCGGGERSRYCQKSEIAVSTCEQPKMSEIENCKKDLCKSTEEFPSSSSITQTPHVTQDRGTPIDEWDNSPDTKCNCGCKLTKKQDKVKSVFKKDILCTWVIQAKEGYGIQLSFNKLDNFDWKNGGLYIAGPKMSQNFRNRKGEFFSSSLPLSYKSKNSMNFTLQNTRVKDSDDDVVLEFEYVTFPEEKLFPPTTNRGNKDNGTSSKGGSNVTWIAGIIAFVFIIVIAIAVVVYRKTIGKRNKKRNQDGDGVEDTCSSISGSNHRSARQHKLTSPRKDRNSSQNKMLLQSKNSMHLGSGGSATGDNDRLINNGQAIRYPDGQDVFIQGQDPNMIQTFIHNGQPYINWPMHLPLINQAPMNYPKQMSFEHITQPGNNIPVYYATSGGEG